MESFDIAFAIVGVGGRAGDDSDLTVLVFNGIGVLLCTAVGKIGELVLDEQLANKVNRNEISKLFLIFPRTLDNIAVILVREIRILIGHGEALRQLPDVGPILIIFLPADFISLKSSPFYYGQTW